MTHTPADTVREMIGAAEGIVLIDFSAEWCSPCRMLDPIVEQLAAESPDVTLVRIDVDTSPELAREHDVMSFPTLLFFVDGRPAQRLVGARGIAALREELEQVRTRTGVRP